jgi:hypothetical protein
MPSDLGQFRDSQDSQDSGNSGISTHSWNSGISTHSWTGEGQEVGGGTRVEFILQIQSQIEYYFSKRNLSTDSYLKSRMDDKGYVALDEIRTFRRLAKLHADTDTILEAVKQSQLLECTTYTTTVNEEEEVVMSIRAKGYL